ncbi:Trimeric GatFAB AmidoTransferase(AdT) complex subunit [Blastocladiella emersonii ATCC 22665]|nr:Trimeric GatFAB AmidoTransferase(AdT) complex subunit [Blastocladiella emersonii ATCC 22665]
MSRAPLSLSATLRQLRSGAASPRAVVERSLAAIRAHNSHCNALVSTVPELTLLAAADEAAARYRDGSARALEGIPVAVKDNFCTIDGLPTACASRVLAGYVSPIEATAVRLLREAGALVVGKANMDEFGMGSFNANSAHGPCIQPGDAKHVAGGSSGGSAVAVQSGMALAALGSDTGGSVRLPASYCGVVGAKPGYGAISRYGLVPYAHSLDTVGVLARTVEDARLLCDLLAQPDPLDMTCTPSSSRTSPSPTPTTKPLKIGVPVDYNLAELHPTSRGVWSRALAALEARGHTVVPVHLPLTLEALAAYYVLAPAEASSNLAKFDGLRYGAHRGELGMEVQRRVMIGAFALSARAVDTYYEQAQRVRTAVVAEFAAAFTSADVLVTPAALSGAPTLAAVQSGAAASPTDAYVNDVFTVPASLAGLPAVVVPAKSETKQAEAFAPHLGVQVLSPRGGEAAAFDVAQELEMAFSAKE